MPSILRSIFAFSQLTGSGFSPRALGRRGRWWPTGASSPCLPSWGTPSHDHGNGKIDHKVRQASRFVQMLGRAGKLACAGMEWRALDIPTKSPLFDALLKVGPV